MAIKSTVTLRLFFTCAIREDCVLLPTQPANSIMAVCFRTNLFQMSKTVVQQGAELASSPGPDAVTPASDRDVLAEEFRGYQRGASVRPLFLRSDSLQALRLLPTASFDCCMTSPPYWGQRQYAAAGIGLETDHRHYIRDLCAICDEVKRVLKPTGSFWLNIGDAYDDKRMLGIPWRVALELTDNRGWILRNDVIWNKVKGGPDNAKDKLLAASSVRPTPTRNVFQDAPANYVRKGFTSSNTTRWAVSQVMSGTSCRRIPRSASHISHPTRKISAKSQFWRPAPRTDLYLIRFAAQERPTSLRSSSAESQ